MLQVILTKICEFIEKRIQNGKMRTSTYLSGIIKFRRNELRMTLFDTSKNICSQALLSKIERNQADPYNEKVYSICERLNLKYDNLIKLESNDRIEELLEMFIDEDFDFILEMNDCSCEDAYIAQDELIKAYKAFIRKDYKELHRLILNLDTVKECLSDIELFCLLNIIFQYNRKVLLLDRAKEYLTYMEMLDLEQEKFALYIKEMRFYLACKMSSDEANVLYKDLFENQIHFSISKIFAFNLYYYEYLGGEEAYKYLEGLRNDYIPEKFQEEYEYACLLNLTKRKVHYKALERLIEIGLTNTKRIVLFAYNLCMIINDGDNNIINEYKQILYKSMKNMHPLHEETYHLAFLKLMQYEIEKADVEIIYNFIKNHLFKELKEYYFSLYEDFTKNRYCFLLGFLNKYKDAYLFLLANKNNLKK